MSDTQTALDQWRRYEYCRDRGHIDFIMKADRCDKFFAGMQWEQEDLDALKLANRPAMTINKIISTLSTLLGEQIYNRTEVLFRPSAGSPAEVAEALSKVWMQVSQNNQLPWIRSDVFADGVIRSRGFYDVRMDYEDNMMGEVRITQRNSKNIVIDPDGEEYDPDKWNDVFETKWFTLADVGTLYSKEAMQELKAKSGTSRYGNDSIDQFRDSFAGRRQNQQGTFEDLEIESRRCVRILERQFREMVKREHFVDLVNGDMRPVPDSWDRERIRTFLEKMGGQVTTAKKLVKRIKWRVTADDLVLHDDWSPYKHFTLVPYFPHFRYGQTIGVVENLLGPQEILNKVSSQELHIVNTTANSGYFVEEDSLVNMTTSELEINGARTGLVVEYRKNAQPPVKIQPNQPPSGLDRISMKAEEHIKTVSNVSDSMMGFDRADVAAKAIQYKNQRGSINMSKILDNLERSDYLLARNVLDLVQEFYTAERIINITKDNFTNDQEQIVVNQVDPITGAITNDLTIGEYDIVITSSPYRASLEDSQFEQAKALREIGIPIPDAVLIENSRLLNRAEIVKSITSQTQTPQAMEQAELNMRMLRADVALKEATVGKTAANTQMLAARAQKESQPEEGEGEEDLAVEAELRLEKYKIDKELELKRYQFDQEMKLKREQMEAEAAQRRVEAARNTPSQPTT